MIKTIKCYNCNTNMRIGWDETRDILPILCPFCGHEFDEEDVPLTEEDLDEDDNWD